MKVEMTRDYVIAGCVLPAGRVFDMPARLVRALIVEGAARVAPRDADAADDEPDPEEG